MSGRVLAVVAVAVALVAVAVLVVLVVPDGPVPQHEEAAERFLEDYVDPDGRVVRHDEGSDTVSEGQAYAMLIAVALGDEGTFEQVWGWTRANLQRDDGLLSWLWADGRVADAQSASDANLDAAHALVLAGESFDDARYTDEGARLAQAILDHETIESEDGDLLLMAGPWARAEGPAINPSYFSPPAFTVLAEETGDPRWDDLADSSRRHVEALLAEIALPPDWAVLEDGRRLVPATPPGDPDAMVVYGLDAARLPIRYALSCDQDERTIAADLWPVFSDLRAEEVRLAYDLGRAPLEDTRHPLTLVAVAATAYADDRPGVVTDFLDEAEALDARHPTYYGAAWVALGRLAFESDRLHRC